MRRILLFILIAIGLAGSVGCGAAEPTTSPGRSSSALFSTSGDAVFTTKGARAFYLLNGTLSVTSVKVGTATKFTGAVSSYDEMAALYKGGYHLKVWATLPYDGGSAYLLDVLASGPTTTHTEVREALPKCGADGPYPPGGGECPQPSGDDWSASGSICDYGSRICILVYPWTTFRSDGDFHSMNEVIATVGLLRAVADGYEVGYGQTHATQVGVWRMVRNQSGLLDSRAP